MKKSIMKIFESYGSLVGTLIVAVIPAIVIIILVKCLIYYVKKTKKK